jgi:excinuclease ABC subunit A
MIKVEMHFLPDIYVPCDVCHGQRYNRETLEVQYKGKNIHEILQMTVEEAHEFFKAVPVVKRKLQTLMDVGLTYIRLGQAATTLSGGEAQRVKLALELSKRDTGRTLYILDEPTTGLHFHDIDMLLKVLHRLVGNGNTVVVIEHNLDVIKTADWVIDLGPEGGEGGGQIIAEGTPEQVAKNKASHTGKYLKPVLKR